MRFLGIILILLAAAIVQTSLGSFLSIYGVKPNLVLVFILSWIILFNPFSKRRTARNLSAIVLAGLFLDCFSGLPFGVISLSLVSTVYLVNWLNQNIFTLHLSGKGAGFTRINFWVLVALAALGTLSYNLLLMALSKMFVIASGTSLMLSVNSAISCELERGCFVPSTQCLECSVLAMTIGIFYNIILIWLIFYGAKKIFYQNYISRKH